MFQSKRQYSYESSFGFARLSQIAAKDSDRSRAMNMLELALEMLRDANDDSCKTPLRSSMCFVPFARGRPQPMPLVSSKGTSPHRPSRTRTSFMLRNSHASSSTIRLYGGALAWCHRIAVGHRARSHAGREPWLSELGAGGRHEVLKNCDGHRDGGAGQGLPGPHPHQPVSQPGGGGGAYTPA